MSSSFSLEISGKSSTPKYKQIVRGVIDKIETGEITYGQKLPSINQLSTEYLLARDTVEKAYNELKLSGVIKSVKWKGFYVNNSAPESNTKVLVLFNKLSGYKKEIYNAIAHELNGSAQIAFFIYHCDYGLFERIINEHSEGYHYYVIMPHFVNENPTSLKALIRKLPKEKLIIVDRKNEGIDQYFGSVHQDFKMDIYEALTQAKSKMDKYKQLILVFPNDPTYPYPEEIILGFRCFCALSKIKFDIIHEINDDHQIQKGSAYVIIAENDLVKLIQLTRNEGFGLGKEVGVISYNETVLKEVLADGITVMSTDFGQMGRLVANMIINNQPMDFKNDFNLILRGSL